VVYDVIVPRFCLDMSLLGTEKHLLVADGSFQWCDNVPKDTWHLNGHVKDHSDWCLDTVLRLSGKPIDLSPPKRFVQAMSIMSGSLVDTPIPWRSVMPAREHQGFTKQLIGRVEEAMADSPLNYYKDAWVPSNGVFRALRLACVDTKARQEILDKGEGNIPAVRSFEPDENNFAPRVCYNRFRTLTGRLTVESGPQILTLKREHRGIIKSFYGDKGTIVALDFAALEARVLLYEYGRKCDDVDLYGMIAKELGQDRKAVKGAVISELYGSSKYALGKVLGIEGKELNEFVGRIKTYFNTEDLLKRVKAQFVSTGYVINRYGRPIKIDEPLDHVMINYYSQSTGADVALLGFKQVIDTLAKRAGRVRPIYLLHDALILDAYNDDLGEVAGIKYVKVKGYVQKFPLRYERLT